MKYVYCSGPLFSPEEIASMSAIASVLEKAGFATFVPHRDGLERYVMGLVNSALNIDVLGSREMIDRAIFALDVYQIIERCEYFVFNMNGRVPDEGACVEAGIAFSVGKPVVLYKNDNRTAFKGRDNSMLLGLSSLPQVKDINMLPEALLEAAEKMKGPQGVIRPRPSENVEKVLGLGRKIWMVLDSWPLKKKKKEQANELVKQVIELAGEC